MADYLPGLRLALTLAEAYTGPGAAGYAAMLRRLIADLEGTTVAAEPVEDRRNACTATAPWEEGRPTELCTLPAGHLGLHRNPRRSWEPVREPTASDRGYG